MLRTRMGAGYREGSYQRLRNVMANSSLHYVTGLNHNNSVPGLEPHQTEKSPADNRSRTELATEMNRSDNRSRTEPAT